MNASTLKKVVLIGALSLLPSLAPPVSAAPHTPSKGSSERTALMNSLRKVLGGGRHKPIITPRQFKVERGWAYINGGFDYAGGTPLEPRFTEGSGTNFSALLQKQGKSWRVKRRIYNGDVAEPDFIRDFPAAPRAIFR